MYISNFTHFLDQDGNIPATGNKKARELAYFHALIVAASTDFDSGTGFDTGIRCFKKGCHGIIQSTILFEETDRIHWQCNKCSNEGLISNWQNSKWDQSR